MQFHVENGGMPEGRILYSSGLGDHEDRPYNATAAVKPYEAFKFGPATSHSDRYRQGRATADCISPASIRVRSGDQREIHVVDVGASRAGDNQPTGRLEEPGAIVVF